MYAIDDCAGGGSAPPPRVDRVRRTPEPALRRVVQSGLRLLRAALTRRRRNDPAAFLALDNRMLADIGLRRGDLQGIAYGVIPPEQVLPAAPRQAALRAACKEPAASWKAAA